MAEVPFKTFLMVPQPGSDLQEWARQLNRFLTLKLDQLDRATDLIFKGTGSPENVVSAPIGAIYQRLDGGAVTTLYVKESGTAKVGWVPK